MISSKMKALVSNSSAIRAMFEEGKKMAQIHGWENVFDFSLGNPNVEPPQSIAKAITEILQEESPSMVHGYMNNSGYEDVRTAIADYLNDLYGTSLEWKHIIMTCGAAGGINILLKSLVNAGEEIIAFSPFFGEYKNYANNVDANLIIVPTNIDNFQPDMEQFRSAITSKTKAVLVNSPNNPTGVIYSEETLRTLAKIMKEKSQELGTEIFLISDEPYRELIYDGVKVPYILDYYDNSIIGYSYSKSLSLPGERIGYLVLNPNLSDLQETLEAINVANRIMGFVNAPSLFQRVIAKTLGSEVDVSIYKRNRDLLYDHLTKIGFTCVKPQGAFYLFPRSPIADDKKFCEDAKEFNLLLVPGSAFGCPGHFRISYCIAYDKIQRSLPAFEKLIEKYK